MADITCDNSSRLLVNGASFRDENLVRNSGRYTCAKEYCAGSPDTISDGDCKGRDPQAPGAPIGTNEDIADRTCSIAKNSKHYTPGHEYCSATA